MDILTIGGDMVPDKDKTPNQIERESELDRSNNERQNKMPGRQRLHKQLHQEFIQIIFSIWVNDLTFGFLKTLGFIIQAFLFVFNFLII